ncbi:MAG: tRNA (adenosine(37)-N6)-threonylcarbamoyltransferase complex transferase subunit TsaD, partial [Clostridia bacterium]|nr:tRNA (adenosine(37)-N6)-threonylcarbamoyltransferase complex transferase subunit TsaD [Clostridia bacterium]
SFSGLKTAVINLVHNTKQKNQDIDVPVLAASIRERVCDILIDKTISAAENLGYKTLAIAGGVSANSELRRRMSLECEKRNIRLFFPQLKYCGDNAAMVGVQGYYEYLSGNTCDETLNATATLPIDYR